MNRDIPFLLKKYETKQPGEEWQLETEVKYLQEYQYKQRLFILDQIVNERTTKSNGTFNLPKAQKDRARYLIKHLDFNLGRTTEEQFIAMIVVYVKLETTNKPVLRNYYPLLWDYDISNSTFVTFMLKITKYYIAKQG